MRTLFTVIGILFAQAVFAQTPVPTSYTATTHFEATPNGTPISSFEFQKASAVCDQAQVAISNVVANPRYIRWTDPERPTRDCVLDTGATSGPLFAMPFGGRYILKLTAHVVVGGIDFSSVASAASNPFVRGAVPAVAGAVRVGS